MRKLDANCVNIPSVLDASYGVSDGAILTSEEQTVSVFILGETKLSCVASIPIAGNAFEYYFFKDVLFCGTSQGLFKADMQAPKGNARLRPLISSQHVEKFCVSSKHVCICHTAFNLVHVYLYDSKGNPIFNKQFEFFLLTHDVFTRRQACLLRFIGSVQTGLEQQSRQCLRLSPKWFISHCGRLVQENSNKYILMGLPDGNLKVLSLSGDSESLFEFKQTIFEVATLQLPSSGDVELSSRAECVLVVIGVCGKCVGFPEESLHPTPPIMLPGPIVACLQIDTNLILLSCEDSVYLVSFTLSAQRGLVAAHNPVSLPTTPILSFVCAGDRDGEFFALDATNKCVNTFTKNDLKIFMVSPSGDELKRLLHSVCEFSGPLASAERERKLLERFNIQLSVGALLKHRSAQRRVVTGTWTWRALPGFYESRFVLAKLCTVRPTLDSDMWKIILTVQLVHGGCVCKSQCLSVGSDISVQLPNDGNKPESVRMDLVLVLPSLPLFQLPVCLQEISTNNN